MRLFNMTGMTIDINELRYQLALSRAPGIGAITFRALLQHWSSAHALFNADFDAWRQYGLSQTIQHYLRKPPWALIDEDLAWQNQPQRHLLSVTDSRYPHLLKEISDSPPILFVLGDLATLSQPQIAIVGSRNPTSTGLEIAHAMAMDLSQLGFCITSGLALGIDAAAHQGALDNQGKTIAVLGNGLNTIYPHRHRALATAIINTGALVSEFSPTERPMAAHFPRRNRIISGLSMGTLVVEATPNSGSLITAKMAASQGRDVFAIPGSIRNPWARGCHQLIQQGAKLVESVADIIAELTGCLNASPSITSRPCRPVLAPDQQKLVECIGFEVTAINEVVARSQLPVSYVAAALSDLALQGYIKAVSGGYLRV
jgi:DNA processing protein